MNKFLFVYIIGSISIATNMSAMFTPKNLSLSVFRNNTPNCGTKLPVRSFKCCFKSERLPLAKAIREKNYAEASHLLPKYHEVPECLRRDESGCCFTKGLNQLENELQQGLVIISAIKIHLQKFKELQKIEDEEFRNKRAEIRSSSDEEYSEMDAARDARVKERSMKLNW